MWTDNETDKDFLNFSGVASTVSEIILSANNQPVSIGVSGAWGVGKSSLIKLVRKELEAKSEGEREYVFVEFNAWLYQGYDDARAALMDVIATKVNKIAEEKKTAVDKTKELLKRIDWFRTAKLVGGTAVPLMLGLPPVGLAAEAIELAKSLKAGEKNDEVTNRLIAVGSKAQSSVTELWKAKHESSPPKEIEAIRKSFEETLTELNITLVVLIDDLDRCLPDTTISTLEAIRLFLFLKNTAFVIAADNDMIKHAVKKHFDGVDDELVTNYFDKLIQVPIRVPPLGTQEVRAYMMLLFVENSTLGQNDKDEIRSKVCDQLGSSWKGHRVDQTFLKSLNKTLPPELTAHLETMERLAPIMTNSKQIRGNPRLIKRFLNALSIRMAIAKVNGINVHEEVVAKMLLFERCGSSKAYNELLSKVMDNPDGKPKFLSEWESQLSTGAEPQLPENWNDEFSRQWLVLPPQLSDIDLRGVLYVSREHAPLITPEDSLSTVAADVLKALITSPEMAKNLKSDLQKVTPAELSIIFSRLLEKARNETEWGTPPILEACVTISQVDVAQSKRFAAFLAQCPPSQIKPSIVPKISGESWANDVFSAWKKAGVSQQVIRAMEGTNGDV